MGTARGGAEERVAGARALRAGGAVRSRDGGGDGDDLGERGAGDQHELWAGGRRGEPGRVECDGE